MRVLVSRYPIPSFRDRRRGISELSSAALTVAHAVDYLVTEQLAGRRLPVQANREAVDLLADAFVQLANTERREPERQSLLSRLPWFRKQKGF